MDMPPSGWYPDPYGMPGLLRWWDGSAWTQSTHEGSASDFSASSGPATMLDATRIGSAPGAAGGEPRTTIDRAAPWPTTVQPAVPSGDATAVQPTTVQPSVTGRHAMPAAGPGQGVHPSWPNAGPGRGPGSPWPTAGPPPGQSDYGTQVLPVGDAAWAAPGGPGDYDDRASRFGHYRDQRRRRMLLAGLLAGGTAVALAVIALAVSSLGSSPSAPAAAQQAPPATSAPASSAPASASASPTPPASAATASGTVTDATSGLSYSLLSSPWNNGCPASLSTQQTLSWTAGQQATAGQFTSNGQSVTWTGEACSAPLPQQDGYNGVADLQPTAANLVNQFDSYYSGLNHQRTQLASTPVSVSGHPGWEIKYQEAYPDASGLGLPFSTEEAAIVVVDEGSGGPPAVFFASVPSNLGPAEVDSLVGSLALTAPQQPGGQSSQPGSQPTQPGDNGNGNGNGKGADHPQ